MFGLGPAEICMIGFIIIVIPVAALAVLLVVMKNILKPDKTNNMEAILTELREIKNEIAKSKA